MAIRDILKVTRKTFVNPTGWLDFDALKARNRTLIDTIKPMMSVPNPERAETYEQALARLDVTDAEVQKRANLFHIYALLFLILGLLVFFYSFYLLFAHVSFTGLLLSLSASAAFFSQAFKFDFWSFQMKRRQLGATFDEWKASRLGDDKGGSA